MSGYTIPPAGVALDDARAYSTRRCGSPAVTLLSMNNNYLVGSWSDWLVNDVYDVTMQWDALPFEHKTIGLSSAVGISPVHFVHRPPGRNTFCGFVECVFSVASATDGDIELWLRTWHEDGTNEQDGAHTSIKAMEFSGTGAVDVGPGSLGATSFGGEYEHTGPVRTLPDGARGFPTYVEANRSLTSIGTLFDATASVHQQHNSYMVQAMAQSSSSEVLSVVVKSFRVTALPLERIA